MASTLSLPNQNIWAVLIGIGKFAPPGSEELWPGPHHDVRNVYRYLRSRGTDQHCIKVLEDAEATRQAIIDAITRHLINNDEIQRDDPILIYYSGHGAQVEAPDTWPRDGNDPRMEVLIAYDSIFTEEYGQEWPIPDRTIAALLRQLQVRRGSNVTVILDCCHSGHMNRDGHYVPPELQFKKRGIDQTRLKKFTPDVDSNIWGPAERSAPVLDEEIRPRGAYFHRSNDTHVLLAACDRGETAEGNPVGGMFTRALLAALHDGEDVSYDRLLDRLHIHYQALREQVCRAIDEYNMKNHRSSGGQRYPDVQTPQCEGRDRGRLLWRADGDTGKSFRVQQSDDVSGGIKRCQILAGSQSGVKVGTVFQIFQTRGGEHDQVCSVTAVEVHPAWSLCNLPQDVVVDLDRVRAVITTFAGPLKYWVEASTTPNQTFTESAEKLRQMIQMGDHGLTTAAVLAPSKEVAEIVLEVDQEGVLVHRQDARLAHVSLISIRVRNADIFKVFPFAFTPMARFHDFLHLQNAVSPYSAQVDIGLHLLLAAPKQSWYEEDSIREIGEAVSFVNDEATIHSPDEDALYAVVLKNRSDKNLFPYVFWFDSTTYEIQKYYAPLNDHDPPLLRCGPLPQVVADEPDVVQDDAAMEQEQEQEQSVNPIEEVPGHLQLGRSKECEDAISFNISANVSRDTGFIKVFLSETVMDLDRMEQPPVLGYEDDRQPNIRNYDRGVLSRAGGEALTEVWDALTRVVTVIP